MLRCLSSSWVSCRCGEKPQVETDSTHLGVLRRIGAGRCPDHCRSNHDFVIHRCESYDSLRTWSITDAGVRSVIGVWAYVGDAVIHEIAQLDEGQLLRDSSRSAFFRASHPVAAHQFLREFSHCRRFPDPPYMQWLWDWPMSSAWYFPYWLSHCVGMSSILGAGRSLRNR